jgi:O-antigen/teichoic acid export membrane protein
VSRSSTILRNVASNWVGFAVNAAVTLALTPFVLHELGTARYGIWILTSSIIGYYGFLDLGFRAGVTQYLTRYLGMGDHVKASECISSAVAVLASLGAVMFGLSLGAAYLAPHVFDLPRGMEREAFWCVLIVGGSTAIQFALNPFTSVFVATQRFDLANVIGVTTRLLTAGGIVIALKTGQGLIGVAAATCTASAVDYVVRWRVARRLVPQIEVSWRRSSVERVREIGAFGAWNSLISVNAFVYQHVPNLLIGSLMPIAAVGHYALATGLARQINSVLTPVPQVLYPAATELHARGDRSGLERLYHDGSRLMLLVMVSVVLVAGLWAEDFYRLWIGEKYLGGAPFQSVALLFQILLISVFTDNSSSIASQILTGAGRVRTVAMALICGSVLNVTMSLVLIRRYGLAGVAVATVIASVVIDLIAMPLLLQRLLGLSVVSYLRRACTRPLAVAALQGVLFVSIRRLTGRPDHWLQLISQGILAGIGSAVIVLGLGVAAAERQRFLIEPIRRLRHAVTKRAEAAKSSGTSRELAGHAASDR